MFPGDIARVALRRWYLVLLGLIATAGLVFGAYQLVPPSYSLTSEVLLMPPETAIVNGDNPYLNLGGLESMADVVSKAMTDDQTKREVKARLGEVAYTVWLDRSAAAPIVVIDTESASPQATQKTMAFLTERTRDTLQQVQVDSGVPAKALITMNPVTQMQVPVVARKAQLRAVVVAAAAGILGTLLLTAAVDAALGFRSRRRSPEGRTEQTSHAGPEATQPEPAASAHASGTNSPSGRAGDASGRQREPSGTGGADRDAPKLLAEDERVEAR